MAAAGEPERAAPAEPSHDEAEPILESLESACFAVLASVRGLHEAATSGHEPQTVQATS